MTDSATTTEAEAPRLSALLSRLEEIRRDLDRDDLDIEDQMRLYREGCEIAARARKTLDAAVAEIDFLAGEGDGGASSETR